jgi:hypothetical protein
MFVYYIDGKKYITDNYRDIPYAIISSPNDDIPAFENLGTGNKIWMKKERKWHRLTGPAIIFTDDKWFCLNDKKYANINDWFKEHPNQDNTFQVEMLLKWS